MQKKNIPTTTQKTEYTPLIFQSPASEEPKSSSPASEEPKSSSPASAYAPPSLENEKPKFDPIAHTEGQIKKTASEWSVTEKAIKENKATLQELENQYNDPQVSLETKDLLAEQYNKLLGDTKSTEEVFNSIQERAIELQKRKRKLHPEDNLPTEDKPLVEELYGSLGRGSARLGEMLANTPSFIYDIAAYPQNKLAEWTGLPISASSAEFAEKLNIPENKIADFYKERADASQKEIDAKYDKGVTEYLFGDKPDYSKGFTLLANQVVESAPISLSMMAGNAAGLTPMAQTLGGGVVFGAGKMQQLDEADMSNPKKVENALSSGLYEGIFEQMGVAKLGGIAKNVFEKEGLAAAKEIAKRGFIETYTPVLKKYVGVGFEESLSEAATQFAENVTDKYSGFKPDVSLMDGVIDAAIVGLGSSVAYSSPVAVADVLSVSKNRGKVEELKNKKGQIEAQIANPETSDVVKDILKEDATKVTEDLTDAFYEAKAEYDKLSDENKVKLNAVNQEINKLTEALQDPTLQPEIRTDIGNKLSIKETEQAQILNPQAVEAIPIQNENTTPIPAALVQEEETEPIKSETETQVDSEAKPTEEVAPVTPKDTTEEAKANQGRTAMEVAQEKGDTPTEIEMNKYIAQNSENVFEIAETYVKAVNTTEDKQGTLLQEVKDSGVKITEKAWREFGDINNLTKAIRDKYISEDASPLDTKADEMGTAPADIIEAIVNEDLKRFEPKSTSLIVELKQRYKELTGKNLTTKEAKRILNVDAKKAAVDYEKHLAEEGKKASEAEKTPKQIAKDNLASAIKAFRNKSQGSMSSGGLQALPEFVALVKAYIEYGVINAKDFVKQFRTDFPEAKHADKDLEEGFNSVRKETNVSGIKKGLLTEEEKKKIEESRDWEKVTDAEMMEMGETIVKDGEVKPQEIIDKVVLGDKLVLDPKEVVALIYHKAVLDKSLRDAFVEKNELGETGQETSEVNKRIQEIQDKIFAYQTMSYITAKQQSLAFRLRKGLRDSNTFDVITEIEYYKSKSADGTIPKDVEDFLKAKDAEIKALNEKISKLENKKEKQRKEAEFFNIAEVETAAPKTKDQKIKEASKKLADKIRKGKLHRPNVFSSANPLSLAWDGAIEIIAKVIEVNGSVLQAVNDAWDHIKNSDAYKNVDAQTQEKAKEAFDGYVETELKTKDFVPFMKDGKLKIPNLLIKDIIKQGVKDYDALFDAIYSETQKHFPEATKEQVRDAISTYHKEVTQTKDDVSSELNKFKRLNNLQDKLDDLKNGVVPIRVKLNIQKKSDYEKGLRTIIKGLEDTLGVTEKKNIERRKGQVKKRIAELQKKIDTQDYSKKEKAPVPKDEELRKLIAEKEKIYDEVREMQYKNEVENRTVIQKLLHFADDLFSTALRAAVAGLDLGALLVQGGLMFNKPRILAKGFLKSLQSLVSEKNYNELMEDIKSKPEYDMIKRSKLSLIEPSFRQKVKEERPVGNLMKTIYDLPATVVEKIIGESKATKGYKALNPFKAAERAYDAMVNYIRVYAFLDMAKTLEQKDGVDLRTNDKELKKLADFINTKTGRANLLAAERSTEIMAVLFFSARRQVSAFQILNPVYYAIMPPAMRKRAIIDSAQSLGILATISVLGAAAMDDGEEDDFWARFWDPKSSAFMSIPVKGDDGSVTYLSLTGAMRSLINVVARLSTGRYTDAKTGVTTYLGERPGKDLNTRADVLGAYVTGKFSPGAGYMLKILKDKKGREVDYEALMEDASMPMWVSDLSEIEEAHPGFAAKLITSFNILGGAAQHYKIDEKAMEELNTREYLNATYKEAHELYLQEREYELENK